MEHGSATGYLAFQELTGPVIGAALEVHRTLGTGFLEAVYHEALCIELSMRQVPSEREKELQIRYKNHRLQKRYCADLVIFGKVIVELKAIARLTAQEESQVFNYLKATGCPVALLINFGGKSLEWKRYLYGPHTAPYRTATSHPE